MQKKVVIQKDIKTCDECPHYHYGPVDDDPGISSCLLTNKRKWHSGNIVFLQQSTAPEWDGHAIPSWCPLPDSGA